MLTKTNFVKLDCFENAFTKVNNNEVTASLILFVPHFSDRRIRSFQTKGKGKQNQYYIKFITSSKLQLHKCSLVKLPECMQFATRVSPKST